MKCPKCDDVEMLAFSIQGVEVDRCPTCDGVWLDKAELEAILALELGTSIDLVSFTQNPVSGDGHSGHCHRCDTPMISLRGAADILFEWCADCEGMFFDKGELSLIQTFTAE